MNYAGFKPRAVALGLDLLIFVPLMGLQVWVLRSFSTGWTLLGLVGNGLLAHGYFVYCHARWGQTLGKRAAGIRVVTLDGEPIGFKQALLRSAVDIVLWLLHVAPTAYVLVVVLGDTWPTMSGGERIGALIEEDPLYELYDVASGIWMLSELVVLWWNKKRRALHDFIAGTVVVLTHRVPVPTAVGRAQEELA